MNTHARIWLLVLTGCGGTAATVDGSIDRDANPRDSRERDAAVDSPSIDAATPRACLSLAMTCGPSGTSSCCDSPLVSGGTFYRSYDVGTDGQHTNMSYPATVSDFRLDKYEVTVGRFRQFVAAGSGTQQHPPADGAGAHDDIATSGWDASMTDYLRRRRTR